MTPLPKRRHSTHRGGIRKAAIKLATYKHSLCPSCGKATKTHRVCKNCGSYKGKVVIKQSKKDKKA